MESAEDRSEENGQVDDTECKLETNSVVNR